MAVEAVFEATELTKVFSIEFRTDWLIFGGLNWDCFGGGEYGVYSHA